VRVGRIRAHWIATVSAVAAVTATWLSVAMTAVAASPTPQPAGGDPRSSGQGPGLVGDPGFALIAVLAIGFGSLLVTLVYVRLTARRGS
jgi:hypothetical protein